MKNRQNPREVTDSVLARLQAGHYASKHDVRSQWVTLEWPDVGILLQYVEDLQASCKRKARRLETASYLLNALGWRPKS